MRSRVLNGGAWKADSQFAVQIFSRMAVALVLARLLTPHDWGLAAMVMVFAAFAVVFTDNALGTALVQRRELLPGDRSTVFWMSAIVGLTLACVGIACSGLIADFYGEPRVRMLFSVLSLTFLISALGTTQASLLTREMAFRVLELRQIAATVAGALVGISVAVAHFGAWAIVSQQLVEATVSTLLLWRLSPWRPSLRLSLASLRRLSGFAGNVFGENVLYQAGRNVNSLLVGRFLGAAALGAYALGTNVILVPFARIAAPLQQVFFPAFSAAERRRDRLADVWIRATRLVALVSFPALGGLVVVAPDFVAVVLGSRWHSATRLIQVLAWVGIVQSVQTLSAEVLLALNRAGTLFRFTLLWFAASVAAFAVGVHWGIMGVAVSFTAATFLIEPVRLYCTSDALGISMFRLVLALRGVAEATAVMAGVLIATRGALVAVHAPAGVRLLALIAVGAGTYLAACLWRAPEIADEIGDTLRRRKQKHPAQLETPAASPGGA